MNVAGADLAADTEFEVVVTSSDAAGNTVESKATSTHTVDLEADAGTVTVANITADDVINANESGETIAVTGTATGGDIAEGDVVTMTINGEDYSTTVDADGNWTVNVAGADLAADTEFEVVVTSSDAAGNTVESKATSTHTVDLEADAGTVTVANITADDVINANESGETIAVTGTATGGDIAEGDVVTMTINGEDYSTTVDADGNWTVNVAGADLAADTEFEVVVTSSDAAGNTVESKATSTHTVDLEADAGTVTVANITADDVINANESGETIAVTGTATGGDIAEGDVVTMTINGEDYSTTVDADGNWTVNVAGADLAADTEFEVVVTSSDAAGNTVESKATSTHTVDLEADAGTVTVANITADDVINANESGETIAVTGTATGGDIAEGDVVTMTINGEDYSTTVDADGNWTVNVAGADLAADTEFEVVVTSSDAAGNTVESKATSTHTVDLEADAGTVTVANITADDVINANESGETIAVTGTATGGDIAEGDVVTMTINGEDYSTTVDADGNWTVNVAGADLAADTEFEVVVTSSDAAGNTVESKATSTHTVDLEADAGTVTVANITADDVINANESGETIAVTGTATGGDIAEGDVVTMTINGEDYSTTVDADGNWTVNVAGADLAADTEFEVVVTSSDAAGNTVESKATSTHTVDLEADAGTVTVANITADDVINANESGETIAVTGTATGGDIAEGDVVTMTINGEDYSTTVDADGNWTVNVAGADLAADTEFEVVVTSSDAAGNTVESKATSTHTVDLEADAGTVTVANITADDVINANESGETIAVTGTATGGDIAEGDVVTMTINGEDYSTTVDADGNWTVNVAGADLAADTEFEVVVTSSDAAGNTVESKATSTHTVDLEADAGTVTVANITADDVINANESGETIAVTGTATGGDIAEGDVVTMTINGEDYSTTVDADGNWTVNVAGADLAADTEFEVVVTSSDAAGNTVESKATSTHTVDLEADAGTVTVANITADDVINANESGETIAVTGTATGGDIAEGDVVTMTINGEDYSTTVDADGNWTVNVAGADLAADTEFEVVVTSSDAAGNTVESKATSTHTVDLEADAGTVTVANITADDVINANESGETIAVTGTATGGDIAEGDVVTMTINGEDYSTTVDADGNWTVNVAGADLAADTEFEVVVTSSDAAGNTVESKATSTHTVDLEADAGTVTVANITADDVINANESGETIAVTGTATGGDIAEGDVVTMTINGEDYSTTVDADGNWTVNVAGADLAADTEFEVVVTSSDAAGNTVESKATSTHTVDLEADAGTVTVANITADDVINANESGETIAVTGTATGGDIAEGDVVTMTINGEDYSTTVDADGNWTVNVAGADLAADTEFEVVVTSSDAAGNTVESKATSTHTVDLEADAGTVTVANITADDVINANESGETIAVTGTATGGDIAEGDVVTMTINGEDYSTTVDADGNWTVNVAGADLAADTEFEVVVTSSDAAGNTVESKATSTHTVDLEADAGTVTVANITADDVINANESGETIAVTGTATGGDIAEGDVVTMTINGEDYSTTVDADGNWTVNVAGADLAADTEFEVVVTSSDAAGNTVESKATSTHTVDLEADAGTVTVANITADDVINANESGETIAVTGTATGGDIAEGDVVTMTINGEDYSTTVDADGNWTVNVAGADLAADTEFEVVVTSSDAAGNTVESKATSTHTVDLEADAGTVTVANITADDVINANESGETIAVTGTATGGDIAEGDVVTMTINGEDYSTTVDADGNWTVNVAGADLAADTEFEVVVTSSDAAGNTVESKATSTHTVDLEADAGTVTVANITADDVINANESGETIAVTGTATGGDIAEGDVVTMTINGEDYSTTVDADGNWTVNVAGADLAADTEFEVVVTSSDAAGNTVESKATSTHTVDTTVSVYIALDDITSDDIVNLVESQGEILVTGVIDTGDYSDDAAINIESFILVINGKDYAVTDINPLDGSFSVSVSGADLLNNDQINPTNVETKLIGVKVLASDAAGNTVDVSSVVYKSVDGKLVFENPNYAVDAEAPNAPVVLITSDLDDNGFINANELSGEIDITISLTGTNAVVGDTLSVNGSIIVLTPEHISKGEVLTSVPTPEEGQTLTVTATITDFAGNTSEPGSDSVIIDTAADAGTVMVASITEDDVINATEAAGTVTVTGTATGGDIAEGDVVTMTINGEGYSTTVDADGNWTVNVAGADLAADTEFEVVVMSSDAAGNTVESKATSIHTVDIQIGTPTISLGAGSDSGESDSDNLTNDKTPSFTFGNIDNDVTSVEVFNGTTKLGDATKVLGIWLFTASEGQLSEGLNDLTVKVTDSAGNSSTSDPLTVTLDTTASAMITIDTIASDGVLNAQESDGVVTITGTVGGDAAVNDVVTLTVNGETYTGKVIADESGNLVYSIGVAGSDLAADSARTIVAKVTGSDAAGNEFTAISDSADGVYTVDTDVKAPTISIAADANEDGVYSKEELGENGTVTATISLPDDFDAAKDTLTINGEVHTLTAAEIEAGEVAVEIDPEETITAQITDAAGNVSTQVSETALGVAPIADAPDVFINIGDLLSSTASITTISDGQIEITVSDDVVSASGGTTVINITDPNYNSSGNLNDNSSERSVIVVNGQLDDVVINGQHLHNINGGGGLDYLYLSGSQSDYVITGGVNVNNGQSNFYGSIKDANGEFTTNFNNIGGIIFGDGSSYQNQFTITESSGRETYELDLSVLLTDRDGSETLSAVTLSGVPDDATIQGGGAYKLANGDWVIDNPTGQDIKDLGLTITVSQNVVDFTIEAKATSTETLGGDSAVGSDTTEFIDVDTAPIITLDANVLDGLEVLTNDSDLLNSDRSFSTIDFSQALSFNFGSDGRGDVTYEIKLDDSSINTGLIASGTGEAISLSLNGGKLLGLTESGVKVFQVTVDGDGKVSMIQYEAISHPEGSKSDDILSLEDLGIKLVITATDADGNTADTDIATTEVDLGTHLKFEDDTPADSNLAVSVGREAETILIGSTSVSFANPVFTSPYNDGTTVHTNVSSGKIEWGKSSSSDTSVSSYAISGAGAVTVESGEAFTLFNLTHVNSGVYTNESSLTSVKAVVNTTVSIHGVTVPITVEVLINHDETLNDKYHVDGDSVTLITKQVEVEVNGESYIVSLDGFRDAATGIISDVVVTPEPSDSNGTYTESYSLIASIDKSDTDISDVITGSVAVDMGADGFGSVQWNESKLTGKYGTLTVDEDGNYSYQVSDVAKLTVQSGQIVQDSFTYVVTDADGDSVTRTLTVDVIGSDWSSMPTLKGEFYNYNESGGLYGNLDSISNALSVIATSEANATFNSSSVDYSRGRGDLGAAGNLEKWLGKDADSVKFYSEASTNDAVIRLTGGVLLGADTYTIRVTADDGYQIKIGGDVVASVNGNQSSTTNTFTFTVTEESLHSLEIIYWDQGGDYQLQVELAGSDGIFHTLGSPAIPVSGSASNNNDYITNTSVDQTFFENVSATLDDRIASIKANAGGEDYDKVQGSFSDGNSSGLIGSILGLGDTDNSGTIEGGSSNDTINGNKGNDHILGLGGDDLLIGGEGNDWLEGGAGNDTLVGYSYKYVSTGLLSGGYQWVDEQGDDLLDGGSGNDSLYGGKGNDILFGGTGNDTLYGGDGDDVLIGGPGQDVMTGGAGKDLFILTNDSVDTITDFNAKEDALDISDLLTLPEDVNSADEDAVTAYLNAHVEIKGGEMKIDGEKAVNFGSDSKFDSNGVDGVTTADSIKVIYNDQEYNINIDG
ncbi:S-layer family protein [Marinomonas sp. FW-1]|uniref:beta strand repeat-containing protein n=1 Tax=Marinomonas sp. FW-1 TaxID=2071621 RepID=UPI0010C00DF5|nr:Ig-like domain-containing protein [Marinomonas sp. FW-1]